jgi:hypothetical protein
MEPSPDDRCELDDNTGEHDADHTHELNKDVETRPGGVLEGVADGITDDGGLVGI